MFDRVEGRKGWERGLTSSTHIEEFLVIESQYEIRGAGEVALHLQSAFNLALDDLSIGGYEHIDLLHNIQISLILAIFISPWSPRDLGAHGADHLLAILLLLFHIFGLDQFEMLSQDRLLEHLNLRCLGVAVVHNLIEELINHNEVVFDALSLQSLEILNQDFLNIVQKRQYHHSVAVFGSYGQN